MPRHTNPYEPPGPDSLGEPMATAEHTATVSPLWARAEVKLREEPDWPIEIAWSGLTGRERYRVAGESRLEVRRFALSGSRRFVLRPDSAKQVEIRFRYFPLWSAQLLYDGRLMVWELFPRLRLFFRVLSCILLVELALGGVVTAWLLLAG
jgi:hypothetical protein